MVWPIWLYDWVFIYELSDFGFESSSSHLNFRFRACSEQGVSWHSGNCRVWIHSEMRTWHDKNIQYLEINFCYNFRLWQGGQLVFNLWTLELFLIFVGTGKINEKCRLSFEYIICACNFFPWGRASNTFFCWPVHFHYCDLENILLSRYIVFSKNPPVVLNCFINCAEVKKERKGVTICGEIGEEKENTCDGVLFW